jgi:hypothetical protein
MLSDTEIILLAAAAAVVVLVMAAIAVFVRRAARRRSAELRGRFGPEYDRQIEERGSVRRAEHELLAREKRMGKRELRPLTDDEQTRFYAEWQHVQARFVDDPAGAVHAADSLIMAVMTARGYDVESFEQRVADLSVDHAGVVQHYRAAHDLAQARRAGRVDTESLRQAMVHHRALFADLLRPQATAQPFEQPLDDGPRSGSGIGARGDMR